MTKQTYQHLIEILQARMAIAQAVSALGKHLGIASMLAVSTVMLLQYKAPKDPPPGRQTSFTAQSQTVASATPNSYLFGL
jgi:hypothetical protein